MAKKIKRPEPKRGIAEAIAACRDQFGKKPLFVPSNRRYIPMRHPGLARLLGGQRHPGLPTGTYLEVLGQEHSGKTTLAFALIDATINQPDGEHMIHTEKGVERVPVPRKVLYMDFEQTLDTDYLRNAVPGAVMLQVDERTGKPLNLDEANVLIHQPDTLDEGCDIMLAMIESGEVGLIVLDSVAAMLTEEERAKRMGENTVGVHARQMGKFFRKSAHVIRRYGVTVCAINQWRDKIGVSFGDPRTAPGGKSGPYWHSIRLDVSGPKKTEWFPGEGKVCNIKAIKNKVSGVRGTATYHLRNGWGLSAEVELFQMGVAAGVVKESGGRTVQVPRKGNDALKYRDKHSFVVALRKSPKLFESIKKACVTRGVDCAAYQDPDERIGRSVGWEDA